MSDLPDEIVAEARLVAVEILLQRLFAANLAKLDVETSVRAKRQLVETAADWEVLLGSPPRDVARLDEAMAVVAEQIRRHVKMIDIRERDVRQNSGQPPADL